MTEFLKSYLIRLDVPLLRTELPGLSGHLLRTTPVARVHFDEERLDSIVALSPQRVSDSEVHSAISEEVARWREQRRLAPSVSGGGPAIVEIEAPSALADHSSPRMTTPHHTPTEDLLGELIGRRLVYPLGGQDFGYGSALIELIDALDRDFVRFLGSAIGDHEEVRFTSLVPIDQARRMNLLREGATHTYGAVSGVNGGSAGACRHVLQNAPCLKIYVAMENCELGAGRAFCVKGQCFRDEGPATYALERLLNFTQREFVFLGSEAYVCAFRDLTLARVAEWMESLGVNGFLTEADDPFFLQDSGPEGSRRPSQVKFEARVQLNPRDSISIASFDLHGDFFGRAFNFGTRASGDSSWSGCIGLGLERCAWAFMHAHGSDPKLWPPVPRKRAPA